MGSILGPGPLSRRAHFCVPSASCGSTGRQSRLRAGANSNTVVQDAVELVENQVQHQRNLPDQVKLLRLATLTLSRLLQLAFLAAGAPGHSDEPWGSQITSSSWANTGLCCSAARTPQFPLPPRGGWGLLTERMSPEQRRTVSQLPHVRSGNSAS